MALVLTNQTSDVVLSPATVTGSVTMQVSGDFDGAEVFISVSQDGLDPVPIYAFRPSNEKWVVFPFKNGTQYVVSVVGSGANTDLNLSVT